MLHARVKSTQPYGVQAAITQLHNALRAGAVKVQSAAERGVGAQRRDLDGAEHSATISRVMAASVMRLVKASEIQSTRGRQEAYAGGGAEATSGAA